MAVDDCSAANTTAHALSTVIIYNIGGARLPTAVTPHVTTRYIKLHNDPLPRGPNKRLRGGPYRRAALLDRSFITVGAGCLADTRITTFHIEAGDGFAGLTPPQ